MPVQSVADARELLFRRAWLIAAALLVLTELGVRVGAMALWRAPTFTETPSAALLRDRLRALQSPQALLFLGDSVAYGSALREHGDAAWAEHTPPTALRRRLQPQGLPVHSLAADGLHPLDLEALFTAALPLAPAAVVVELNYRMLSAEAGRPATALVRPYLADWLSSPVRAQLEADLGLGGALGNGVRRGWATWRYMEALSFRVLQPSLAERLRPLTLVLTGQAGGTGLEDEDAQEALLGLKIRPYYQAPIPAADHLGWQSLRRLAAALRTSNRPSLVFLTPQNPEKVGVHVDPAAYRANRAELARIFAASGRLRWADWAERRPRGRFLDHCHLDAEGNQGLADWIHAELKDAL